MPVKKVYLPVTERDLEVLDMRADGMIFEEIAKRMRNQLTGEMGVSQSAARIAYFTALKRTVYAEEQHFRKESQEFAEKYCQEVCKIILEKLS